MYLKIENSGFCDTDALLMLGVSTTRSSSQSETIGMFGSGTKHAICVCLRHGLNPIIFVNQLRMEFFTQTRIIHGVNYGQQVNVVNVKISGKDKNGKQIKTEKECGFVQEFGAIDWTDINMGLREFVSNALDASKELDRMDELSIELVADNQVRAKTGNTRVFVFATPEVNRFYTTLGDRFLHFTHEDVYTSKLLPAASDTGKIYRRGVLVGNLDKKSLFDYNLRDVELDESRNIKGYTAINAVGNMLAKATVSQIMKFMESTQKEDDVWEHGVNSYNVDLPWEVAKRKPIFENWETAWKNSFGDNAVICRNEIHLMERLEKKGFKPVPIDKNNIFELLESLSIPSHVTNLNSHEQKNIEYDIAPESLLENVSRIWNKLWVMNLTNNKEMPKVLTFKRMTTEGKDLLGFYSNEESAIFINQDMVGESEKLNETILEELSHHITGASDYSRDFQNFILKIALKMIDS